MPRTSSVVFPLLIALTSAACSGTPTTHTNQALTPHANAQAKDSAPGITARSPHARITTSDAGFCQILSSGRIRCRELTGSSPIAYERVIPPQDDFISIASTRSNYCALSARGTISCWKSVNTVTAMNLDFPGDAYTQLVSDGDTFYALDRDGVIHHAFREKDYTTEVTTARPLPSKSREAFTHIFALHSSHGVCASHDKAFECFYLNEKDGRVSTNSTSPKHGAWPRVLKSNNTYCGLKSDGVMRCYTSTHQSFSTLEPFNTLQHDAFTLRYDMACARRVTDNIWHCNSDELAVPDEPMEQVSIVNTAINSPQWYQLAGITPDGRLLAPYFALPARHEFVELSDQHMLCAVRADDTVFCNAESRFGYDDDLLKQPDLTFTHTYNNLVLTNHGSIGMRDGQEPDERQDVLIHGHRKTRDLPDAKKKKKFVDIQHGNSFSCGLLGSGEVDCWGSIMGDATKIKPPKQKMSSIALGGVFACGITKKEGKIVCWGDDYYAFLTHAPVDEPGYDELRTSYLSICAHREDDTVKCWGQGFWETFTLPVKTSNYGLFNGGVCAVPSPEVGMKCWGAGVLWN